MLLFTHQIQLVHHPIIEFENHDGRWFQLISNITKHGFGPHRVTIVPEITESKIIVNITQDPNADDEVIGLFCMMGTLSYKCVDPSYTLFECLAKHRMVPYYQPRIGFYKPGAKIDKYYMRYDNKVAKYVWELGGEGWTSTSDGIRLKFV